MHLEVYGNDSYTGTLYAIYLEFGIKFHGAITVNRERELVFIFLEAAATDTEVLSST